MNKAIIEKNFSRNAAQYDRHASIQKQCAEKLVDSMKEFDFSNILEAGCGTGIYTFLLHTIFSSARITATDISEKMLKIARNKFVTSQIEFIKADIEEHVPNEKFDLITSNASFQWLSNLGSSFGMLSNNLTPEGIFCFSMYGPETYNELRQVINSYNGQGDLLSATRFTGRDELENILGTFFDEFHIAEEQFTVSYPSLWGFLRDIKYSGARGEGLKRDKPLGKHAIERMEELYINKFGGITATHHVYFCRMRKKGENI